MCMSGLQILRRDGSLTSGQSPNGGSRASIILFGRPGCVAMISRGASQNAREKDALCRPRLHGHGACAEALGALSYQPLLALTTRTTSNMTGTSISTPTTVARAAPDSKPNRLIAAATASSKKFEAPIRAEGQATLCFS